MFEGSAEVDDGVTKFFASQAPQNGRFKILLGKAKFSKPLTLEEFPHFFSGVEKRELNEVESGEQGKETLAGQSIQAAPRTSAGSININPLGGPPVWLVARDKDPPAFPPRARLKNSRPRGRLSPATSGVAYPLPAAMGRFTGSVKVRGWFRDRGFLNPYTPGNLFPTHPCGWVGLQDLLRLEDGSVVEVF